VESSVGLGLLGVNLWYFQNFCFHFILWPWAMSCPSYAPKTHRFQS